PPPLYSSILRSCPSPTRIPRSRPPSAARVCVAPIQKFAKQLLAIHRRRLRAALIQEAREILALASGDVAVLGEPILRGRKACPPGQRGRKVDLGPLGMARRRLQRAKPFKEGGHEFRKLAVALAILWPVFRDQHRPERKRVDLPARLDQGR